MSPVAPIVHLLAIAAGIWGGFWIAERVAPDLPEARSGQPAETRSR